MIFFTSVYYYRLQLKLMMIVFHQESRRATITTHAGYKWTDNNISVINNASDFKFGMLLGFAKGHQKITPREKSGRCPVLESSPKNWGFPFNNSATAEATDIKFCIQLGCWGLPSLIIKSHPGEILGSLLIFLQRPRCPLSVSGASCFIFKSQ